MRFLERSDFDRLLSSLVESGYDLIGPTVRDGAVVLEPIDGVHDLPRGVRDEQGPGRYRLSPTGGDELFAWSHGPDSAKRFLFPAREVLGTVARGDSRMSPATSQDGERPLAFVGLRSCDLHAVAIQDRVFMEADPAYRRRRERAVFIGVNCEHPGSTCFCASMGAGPRCAVGFDLALTELPTGFVVEVGGPRGEELIEAVTTREASEEEEDAALRVTREAEVRMDRTLDTQDMPEVLYRNRRHPRWKEVAERCLACGNCTSACPTCFCHDLVDASDITGARATRTREWASCFSEEYSWAAGASVRAGRDARYRQWLTHKFASWIDQFGTSGCVGCGRCITWCPVGIDVTEEVAVIRATDGEVEVVAQ